MRADNLTRQGASQVARELLDEAVSRLREGYLTEQNQRNTELQLEAARGYLWLAQVETAELAAGRAAAAASRQRLNEVNPGLVPGGALEPEDGGSP